MPDRTQNDLTNWKAFLIGVGGSALALSPLLLIIGLALLFGGNQ